MGIIYHGDNGEINVDNLIMTNKDGNSGADVKSSTGEAWISRGYRTRFRSINASINVLIGDSGETFSNVGTSQAVIMTLPDANIAGLFYHFINSDATYAISVAPKPSDQILYSGGILNAGTSVLLADQGDKISLISDGNGLWLAISEFGL